MAIVGYIDGYVDGENEYSLADTTARNDITAINGKIPEGASSSNQLVTRILLENSLTDKVDKTSVGANNGVAGLDSTGRVPSSQLPSYVDDVLEYASQSAFPATGETGKIYIALDTNKTYRWSGSAYVEISESLALGETASTAYAGNKGKANADAIAAIKDGTNIDSFGDVETALADKVDKVTGKGLSTNDYDATAKGIVDNIQSNVIANTKLIKDTVGWSGKNLLKNTATSQTINGVTFTVNADKSITVNGTATAQANFYPTDLFDIHLSVGKYIVSGNPTGASKLSTYWMYLRNANSSKNWDIEDDIEITVNTEDDYKILIAIANGYTANNLTFYPMIRSADILDDTYEPYRGTTAFPRDEQAILGAKNLCPMPFSAGYTLTVNGITFTVNDDGSYIADGTCGEGGAFLQFYRDYNNNILQKGKTYIASSGQTANGGTQVYYRESYQSGDWVQLANAIESEKTFTVPNNANIILIRGYIGGGNTVSNKTYYPMIRLATDPDDTFASPAMTNKQLTDEIPTVTDIKADCTSSVATINSLFISKVGKIAYISGVITLTSNVSAGGELITLPTKYAVYQTDGNSGRYPLIGSNGATTIYHLFVQPSSETKIFLAESANSGASIRFGGIYLLN